MNSNDLNRQTSSAYINESATFPSAIAGVPTAVPVFIGYTNQALGPSGQPVYLQPVVISSLDDYQRCFGTGFRSKFRIVAGTQNAFDFMAATADGNGSAYYRLVQVPDSTFYLYNALRLFFANGGGDCYVVSCGNYAGKQDNGPILAATAGTAIRMADLQAGLTASGQQYGPTMVVIPDACQLDADDYSTLANATLAQCAHLQDRMAILDLSGSTDPASWNPAWVNTRADDFYKTLQQPGNSLSFAAAYYPALRTSIVAASEVDFTNLDIYGSDVSTARVLAGLLTCQCQQLYCGQPQYSQVMSAIARILPDQNLAGSELPVNPDDPQAVAQLDQYLTNTLPLMGLIKSIVQGAMNVAPVSGPVAGVWARNDRETGVWNAPANQTLTAVVAPTILLTDDQQGLLNQPDNGMAINAIRHFGDRGSLVWGARTLDGNSGEYRYIQTRRNLIYIEQSIKAFLKQMVFAANDSNTWTSVSTAVSGFLTGVWEEGGLMGDSASEAFSVQCGLGSSMNAQDVLDGFMVVSVSAQVVYPGEFMVLTFRQGLQGA